MVSHAARYLIDALRYPGVITPTRREADRVVVLYEEVVRERTRVDPEGE
jgi:hypothetical protein